jgi:hypothetical protein
LSIVRENSYFFRRLSEQIYNLTNWGRVVKIWEIISCKKEMILILNERVCVKRNISIESWITKISLFISTISPFQAGFRISKNLIFFRRFYLRLLKIICRSNNYQQELFHWGVFLMEFIVIGFAGQSFYLSNIYRLSYNLSLLILEGRIAANNWSVLI